MQKLEELVTDLVYSPSTAQRKVKAKYWNRANATLFTDQGPELAQVQRIVRDKRLEKWWADPSFVNWFQNNEEFRDKMESNAQLAVEIIEQIMLNGEKDSDRLNAAKLSIEAANRMPKRDVVQFADAKINQMDAKQLEAFIEANAPKLAPVIEVVEEEKEDD